MFCFNCGAKIADGSNFCPFCGTKITNSVKDNQIHVGNGNPSMRPTFVPAKCTCCGATLEVDPRQEAAVCRFCNTPFIVEKAINNYNISLSGNINVASATINIQGKNLDNLIKRAKIFEEKGELRNALKYYEDVLDMDVDNQEAYRGSERVKEAIRNYVYLSSDANMGLSYGTLKLMKGLLCYEDKKGKIKSYNVNQISELSKFWGTVIQFKYPGLFSCVSIGVTGVNADTWISAIINAQNGIYPNSDNI